MSLLALKELALGCRFYVSFLPYFNLARKIEVFMAMSRDRHAGHDIIPRQGYWIKTVFGETPNFRASVRMLLA